MYTGACDVEGPEDLQEVSQFFNGKLQFIKNIFQFWWKSVEYSAEIWEKLENYKENIFLGSDFRPWEIFQRST